jgi:hypothetical protein
MRRILLIDALTVLLAAAVTTVLLFVFAPRPVVPFSMGDRLLAACYSAIIPVWSIFWDAPFTDWFLSRWFCLFCTLGVGALLAVQFWRRAMWATGLGVVGIFAWFGWGAFQQYCAMCAAI